MYEILYDTNVIIITKITYKKIPVTKLVLLNSYKLFAKM